MNVIYIDSLFALNLLADYLICLVSARVCGLYLKRLRYFIAAFFGAVYSVAVYFPSAEILTLPASKLSVGLLMGIIAFGSELHPFRCTAVFFCISAAFGGGVWALSMLSGSGTVPLNLKTLVFSFSLCYAAASIVFRGKLRSCRKQRLRAELHFMGKTGCFMALVDTGNSLCDPISGKKVMLVCPHALAPLFSGYAELLHLPAVELMELSCAVSELKGKFRLIPYSVIGSQGLLPVFTADRLLLDGIEQSDILIGIAPNASGDGFEALI